jgi:predicted DNA-binding transcriptional regulator YafY
VSEREWHASQRVERLPSGDLELYMEAGGSQELANWVLSFGDGATVLEPESLRAEVLRALEKALGNYA